MGYFDIRAGPGLLYICFLLDMLRSTSETTPCNALTSGRVRSTAEEREGGEDRIECRYYRLQY